MNFNSFFDEMSKVATSRWRRELAKGSIGLSDLPGGSVRAARGIMQSLPRPTIPLKELDRRAAVKVQGLLQALPALGIDAHALGRNTKARTFPSTAFTPPIIGIGEGAGRLKRVLLQPGGLADKQRVAKALARKRPGDAILQHATWRHEIGEAKDITRAARGESVAEHSSHKGLTPLLEEYIAAAVSPRAHRIQQAVRAGSDAADRFTAKKLREAGMGVGTGVVLPEGRTSGKIEAAIRRKFPKAATHEDAPRKFLST